MKPLKERLPLIDAAIDELDGDVRNCVSSLADDRHIALHIKSGGYHSYHYPFIQNLDGFTYVGTVEEFNERKRELEDKEQNMNWYEKGELPPVGSMVEVFDCHAQLRSWNGRKVEVLKNIKTPDSGKVSVVLFDGWVDATLINTKKLIPLQNEKG